MRGLSRPVLVLCLQVLTVAAYGGTITVQNLEPDTVNVIVRQNNTTKTAADVGAGATYTFNSGQIVAGVDCEIRYTYTGSTRTAGTWPEGSSDAKIPSSRFRIRVINNTASAIPQLLIKRAGTTVNDWGNLAAFTTTETSATGWSDFWFGGPGTYTVQDGGGSLANPTLGLATADYVQGFGVAPGVMIFTFGSATYEVTRCIRNNHTGAVTMYWERDGTTVRTEYNVPAGVTVCHTYTETAGTSHNYREQVQVSVTQVNPDGSHTLTSTLETTGTLNNNGGTHTGTGEYTGPDLPANASRFPLAQTNFTGTNGFVGFTNQNLGAPTTEGTMQAGFNAVIAADNANTDRVVNAVTAAGSGIEGALSGLSFTNPVTVNLTNNLTITNSGDGITNLLTRWDSWSNRGAVVESMLAGVTNYSTQSQAVQDTGSPAAIEQIGFPGGLDSPAAPGGGAEAWTVSVGGYTFNLDPVTHPLFGPMLNSVRGWIGYLMLGIYVVAIFRRLDECSQQTMLAVQTHVPSITVMGNSVGWASSPVLLAVVSTTLASVPAALLVLWQNDSSAAAFASGSSSIFTGLSGPVGMAARLAWAAIPFETFFSLLGAWFLVMSQSRVIVFVATFVIRLLPA